MRLPMVGGSWSYADTPQAIGQLWMQDDKGTRQLVERIHPREGRRTLGVRLAGDGNMEAEKLHLRGLSEKWAAMISQGYLPRHLAWRALTLYLWPQLLYPLQATTFSHSDCRFIMAPALKAGLAAAGVVGTFPRVLTHGSPELFGLGLWDLYLAQGWAQITTLLRHGPDPSSISGRLIRTSLELLTIELGLPGPALQQDFDLVGILATESWVKSMCSSCGTIGCE